MLLPKFDDADRGVRGGTLWKCFLRRSCRRVCAICILLVGAFALGQTYSHFIFRQAYLYMPAGSHMTHSVASAPPTKSVFEDSGTRHTVSVSGEGTHPRHERDADIATTSASTPAKHIVIGVSAARDRAEAEETGNGRPGAAITLAASAPAGITTGRTAALQVTSVTMVTSVRAAALQVTAVPGKRKIVKKAPPAEVLSSPPPPNCTKVKRYVFLHWAPHWSHHRIPHGHKTLKDCPYDCVEWVQTSDKSYLPEADIVAVHDWTGSPALPAKAHPKQLFMFITMESPFSPYSAQHKMHLFQLQYTYRLESDARAAYIPIGISSFESISGPPPVPFAEKHDEAVSSLVSNCGGFVPRVKFMRELSQHIALHSYGACFHNRNLPSHSDIHPLEKYKFAMVFENSLCHDYVTEKWWRALTQGTVPLVTSYKGVPDYRKFGPTLHSYINIADYADTKAVAERLKEIARDEDLYDYSMEHRYMKRLDLNPLYLQNFANSTCDDFCRLTVQKLQVPAEMEKLLRREIPRDTSCAASGILKG